VTFSNARNTLRALIIKGRGVFAERSCKQKTRMQKNSRDYLRKLLANQIAAKKSSESQTTPIQPSTNTCKDEETKMAKKVKKAAKKPAKKMVRKAAKKTARKTVRKAAKKSAKKPVRKAAKKTARKTVRKAAKKTVRKARKTTRKVVKAPAAAV
jgi:hypothetical protein